MQNQSKQRNGLLSIMEHINHSDIDTSLHCIRPRTSTPILQSSMAAADSSQGEFAVDPDWNPFPLKCKAEFEDLEILLSQSVDHRLVLVSYLYAINGNVANIHHSFLYSFQLDFFRVFLSPDLGDWLQLLKLIVKDEAVAHVTSAKELETYWLFTATFGKFVTCH